MRRWHTYRAIEHARRHVLLELNLKSKPTIRKEAEDLHLDVRIRFSEKDSSLISRPHSAHSNRRVRRNPLARPLVVGNNSNDESHTADLVQASTSRKAQSLHASS